MNLDYEKFFKGRKITKNTKGISTKKLYKGAALTTVLAGLGILVTIFPGHRDPDEKVQIGTVKDAPDDAFYNTAPVKTKDGKTKEVEQGSAVIVNGKEEDGSYPVTALGPDFDIVEGMMDVQYVEISNEMSFGELEERLEHVYEVSGAEHVNVRNSTSMDESAIISKIAEGERVLGGTAIHSDENGLDWVPVLYADETGKYVSAYISEDYLKLMDRDEVEPTRFKVNTSKDKEVPLNMRTMPVVEDGNIEIKIPNGAVVEETTITDTESEGRTWKYVRYLDDDGVEHFGWVSANYLNQIKEEKDVEPYEAGQIDNEGMLSDKEYEGVIDGLTTNDRGEVVGIDINGMSPEFFRNLLESDKPFPNTMYYWGNENMPFGVEDVNQKIDYVYIRIGCRYYGNSNPAIYMNPEGGDDVYERIKACEELGVPYGLYFYSTALTQEEADEEIESCKEFMDTLEDKVGSTKYNILPFALNSEAEIPESGHHRVWGNDITDIDAYWLNRAEPYFGKLIIYAPDRCLTPGHSDQIIYVGRLNEQVISGKPKLWINDMRNMDGTNQEYNTAEGKLRIEELGGDVGIVQTVVDVSNKAEGFTQGVDIDFIDKNELVEMLNKRREEMVKQKISKDAKASIKDSGEVRG